MKKIMIVEDDSVIKEELLCLLKNANYDAVALSDFSCSLDSILNSGCDLVLLDINIPFLNGELLLKEVRKVSSIPIIMVTSKATDVDEVLCYSYGADDYITKPYNPTILLLKINALFKRLDIGKSVVSYNGLFFDVGKGIVKYDDKEVILTKNEIIIFNLLINNRDRIVSKDELMTDLWNNDEYVNENALVVNISRLRSKLSLLGFDDIIETRKGIGYRIV